jgi:hypothetical protein
LLILTAIKYYEVLSTSGNFTQKDIYPFTKLINYKQKMNIQESAQKKELAKNPISNTPHRFSLGGYKNDLDDRFLTLGYRALYRHRFDMFDDVIKNGSVEFFDLSLKKANDSIKLDYFNLINLESIPIYNRYFPESTNRITLGMKRLFSQDNLYSFFEYTKGYKFEIFNGIYYKPDLGVGFYINSAPLYSLFYENSLEVYTQNNITTFDYDYYIFNNKEDLKHYSINNYYKLTQDKTVHFYLKKSKQDHYKNDSVGVKLNIGF